MGLLFPCWADSCGQNIIQSDKCVPLSCLGINALVLVVGIAVAMHCAKNILDSKRVDLPGQLVLHLELLES